MCFSDGLCGNTKDLSSFSCTHSHAPIPMHLLAQEARNEAEQDQSHSQVNLFLKGLGMRLFFLSGNEPSSMADIHTE